MKHKRRFLPWGVKTYVRKSLTLKCFMGQMSPSSRWRIVKVMTNTSGFSAVIITLVNKSGDVLCVYVLDIWCTSSIHTV